MSDLLRTPVRELAELITTRKLSSKQLTRTYLDQIEVVNPGLNALVHLDAEMAMKQAERNDIALGGGETPGRLFGIPMTIKDSLNTYDMLTTWGTEGRKNTRPGKDATVVARLRQEGAILMGKTNTPEFTLSFKTDNTLVGRTNNPFDPERTSGGSSGGAAALIACHGTPFDIGTDTGGSIRLPAHFCGITGIKPTTGRIPCTGNALPSTGLIAPLTQPGPMARRVDDLIYLLSLLAGPDNIDPHAVQMPWFNPEEVDINQLRIGFHLDNGIKTPDASIMNAISATVDLLRDDGLTASEARPSGLEMTAFIYAHVMSADNGDLVATLLEDCGTTHASPDVARLLSRDEAGLSAVEFAQVINLWHNYQSSMLSYFDQFDVLLCPVNAHTAIRHNEPEDFAAYTYTEAYNLTGWPAVVIRIGTDGDGLPIGLQIVSRPCREDQALALAAYLEARLGGFEDRG